MSDSFDQFSFEDFSRETGEYRYHDYDWDDYETDVKTVGLARTWDGICRHVRRYGQGGLLRCENFSRMYEAGLALTDKRRKKASGQYGTPEDVSRLMCRLLLPLKAENVCDVGCGVGNLILCYLDLLGPEEARRLLSEGRVYLYDSDPVALEICRTAILTIYGEDVGPGLHLVTGDFLSGRIHLPEESKVISNPPYAPLRPGRYKKTRVRQETKELYAAFLEKILTESDRSVVITPYSFLGGGKFYALRRLMNEYNGFVAAFDNVPGNIFRGKKQGVFNSNTSNSVRAAITVTGNDWGDRGYAVSPLIRFRSEEREIVLTPEYLQSRIDPRRQTVSDEDRCYRKLDRRLAGIYDAWMERSDGTLKDCLAPEGEYLLAMPTTCRYFTVATDRPLRRGGQHLLRVDGYDRFCYLYCLLNSSFAYWHWRIYDGGITYGKGLLQALPVPGGLTAEDAAFFRRTAEEMIRETEKFVVRKNNVGVQENVKFPREYRDAVNERILRILGRDEPPEVFDLLHSTSAEA